MELPKFLCFNWRVIIYISQCFKYCSESISTHEIKGSERRLFEHNYWLFRPKAQCIGLWTVAIIYFKPISLRNLAITSIKFHQEAVLLLLVSVIDCNCLLVLSGDFLYYTPNYMTINYTHSIPYVVVLLSDMFDEWTQLTKMEISAPAPFVFFLHTIPGKCTVKKEKKKYSWHWIICLKNFLITINNRKNMQVKSHYI